MPRGWLTPSIKRYGEVSLACRVPFPQGLCLAYTISRDSGHKRGACLGMLLEKARVFTNACQGVGQACADRQARALDVTMIEPRCGSLLG